MDKSDNGREQLSDKLRVPSNRLMVLMPFLGIASLIALGAVLVLGISMLETLAKRADRAPVQLEELRGQVSQLSAKIKELEFKQETLAARIARVAKLADELYLDHPLSEPDKERIRLMKLPPAEILRQGMTALTQEGARPALYFEAILDAHPDSPEARAAMLQLGTLRVRGGDHTGAVGLLSRFLDQAGEVPDYDAAWANYYLGVATSCLGKDEDAVYHYRTALGGFPESDLFRATTRSNLGELYLRLGEKEKAAVQFEALLEEFEGDERAAGMLKRASEKLQSLKSVDGKQ